MTSLPQLQAEFRERFPLIVLYKQNGMKIADFDYHEEDRAEIEAFITTAYLQGITDAEGCVPEEKPTDTYKYEGVSITYTTTESDAENLGFNHARIETLSNLQTLRADVKGALPTPKED